jgi:hypothetical protein
LISMRERIRNVNGELVVFSALGKGTLIRAAARCEQHAGSGIPLIEVDDRSSSERPDMKEHADDDQDADEKEHQREDQRQ